MAKIWLGAVGRISKGHVLDVNEKAFERALKDYDHLLYVKWNPNKLKGHGCWEIRRKPAEKTIVDYAEYKGAKYFRIEYMETDLTNHVLDCAFLNYDQLRKLQQMDLWSTYGTNNFVDALESEEASAIERKKEKALQQRKEMAREYKREIRDFKELLLSGASPDRIITDYWK